MTAGIAAYRNLTAARAVQVADLIRRATEADGVIPVSEHQLLRLSSANDDQWWHIVAERDGTVVGYAIVEPGAESAEAELVVDPAHRRHGIGAALLADVRAAAGDAPLLVWAHGHLPGARALAESDRLTPTRKLWQLRRSLSDPIPAYDVPAQIMLRAYDPERDGPGWLAVNAAAFAHHPEQGAWQEADLRDREREPWFDPAGFLIAEVRKPLGDLKPGELAGFHWTKIHGPDTATLAAHPDRATDGLGEVYVVGVSPRAQGIGLGKVLTLAGLHHLRDKGLPAVLLYVDDDNAAAMRLYRTLGFTEYAVDVQYRS